MNSYNCKYKFYKVNMEINIINNLIDKVWDKRTIQVFRLLDSMGFNNDVNFDCLWLSVWWLNKLRAKLVNEWVIKKWKLSGKIPKWYINPYYFNRWAIDPNLLELFKKENRWVIF